MIQEVRPVRAAPKVQNEMSGHGQEKSRLFHFLLSGRSQLELKSEHIFDDRCDRINRILE